VPTLAQVEEQILAVEGFRVRFEPLSPKTKSIPSYDFTTMAPQRWKISDWKNARLKAYVALLRGVTIARGDGTAVKGDLQLGSLRDSYYAAHYGSLEPPQ
jgi:hypothetical protein